LKHREEKPLPNLSSQRHIRERNAKGFKKEKNIFVVTAMKEGEKRNDTL